ncbi:Pkinase domain containing protein [Tylopilus felleus]
MAGRDFTGKQVGQYFLSSKLGLGASGGVYYGVDVTLQNAPTYAIKCMPQSSNPKRRSQQAAEVANHDAVILCPHVLNLYDFFEEDDCIFLVLPLCEMDMERAIFGEKMYWRNDALIKKTFVDILDGVFACHIKGVFHRDLKPENIMCNADGTKIKIGDFGLSTNRRICRDGGCGTLPYMSPECLDKHALGYDANQADIWSLGVILFNMVTLRFPWEQAAATDNEYMAFLAKKNHILRTYPISESLSGLLCRIWDPTPMKRMSIPAIRRAILEMDTFYKARRSSHAASPLSKEVLLIDS